MEEVMTESNRLCARCRQPLRKDGTACVVCTRNAAAAKAAFPGPAMGPQGPKGPGQAARPDGRAVTFNCTPIPKTVDDGDYLQMLIMTHAGVGYRSGRVEIRNPHRMAEFERYATRTKMAHLLVQNLRGSVTKQFERDELDVIILFPSGSEISTYRGLMDCRLEGDDAKPLNIDGYRLNLLGSDQERGRIVYPTSLAASTRYIGGDMLYYLNPEGYARMFESHPAIKQGLTLYLAGRHFCSRPNSLYVDRYKFLERDAGKLSQKVAVKTMVPALTKAKTPKFAMVNGKAVGVLKEQTTWVSQVVDHPALAAVDYIEGHGLVSDNGSFDYFASSAKGDSSYHHVPGELDGCFLFEHSKYAVRLYDGFERFFQISIHMEWTCVNLSVLRVHIQEVEQEGVTVPIPRNSHAFVQGGVIPTILSSVRQKATGSDMESAESMKSLYDAAFRQMVSSFGKSHYDKLPQYHQFLLESSNRTVDLALRLSRVVPPKDVPLHGAYADIARARVVERIVDETHVPVGVASAYARLTEKQTRAQFVIQLARTCYEGLVWLWEKVRAFFSKFGPEVEELSIASQFVQLISVLKRNSKRVSGLVDKLLSPITKMSALRNALLKVDSWASRYPRARSIFEDVVFAGQCIVVAYGEELVKRWTPAGFAAMFGAIEGLILGVGQLIDDGVTKESLARVIAQAASTALSHFILRLMPMWVAVPIHALYNFLVGRGKSRWWNDLIEFLQLDILEQELDDMERAPVSLPVNLVEQSKVYMKEQDGTRVYIKDDPEFTQMIAMKQIGSKVISVLSDATRMLVKPSGSILDLVLITVSRLDKPLPYVAQPKAWDFAMRMFLETFAEPLLEEQGPLKIYSKGELINYVNDRPWDNTRKEETIAIIRSWTAECNLRRPQDVTAKEDEVIPNQPTLSDINNDNNAKASKTRPICPRAEADLPSMAIAVPLKKWMQGQRYWKRVSGFPRWEYVKDPSMELGFLLSVDYQMAPRADLLSAWFNRVRKFHGLHFALHGDDQYALFVDVHGDMLACAIDLSMCDKTCGEIYQQKFASFVNYVSEESHLEDVQRQFDNLVGEFQLKSRRFPAGTPALFWDKTERSTNTGEPLTSVKAIFAQLPAIFVTVDKCFVGEEFRFQTYKEHTTSEWKKLGLIPEFETDPQGAVWHHPSAVTYLGGMFVERIPVSKEDWIWISNKQLKAYMVFPAVEKIYGPALPMQKHMAVLLQDPDLTTTPVGRALARWFQRCCVVFRDFDEIRRNAMARYENHLAKTDRYKLELMQDAKEIGRYTPESVWDISYYHAADHMLARNGSHYTSADIVKIVDEIDKFPGNPQQELATSAIPLYVLRFGNPKASPDTAEDTGLAELNIVGAIFNLGMKIFSEFIQTDNQMSNNKKKAKSRSANGPNKKWYVVAENPNLGKIQFGSGQRSMSTKPRSLGGTHTGPTGAKAQRGDMVSIAPGETSSRAQNKTQLICQDELVQTVSSSIAFNCVSLLVQPGFASVFPWLAQIAVLFQKYRIRSMKFYFKPTVSQYNALGQAGRLVLSFDTDSASPLLTSLEEAEGMAPHADGMAYEKLSLIVPDRAKRPLFIRSGPQPVGTDIKTYDAGRLFISTQGMTAAAQIGELRVKYEVEVFQPMLPDHLRPAVNTSISKFQMPSSIIMTSGVGSVNNPTLSLGNGLDLAVDGAGIHMPAGWFQVTMHHELVNSTNSAGVFQGALYLNSAVLASSQVQTTGAASQGSLFADSTVIHKFNDGDFIQCYGYSVFGSGTTTYGCWVTISIP